jgi:hypothetical protein
MYTVTLQIALDDNTGNAVPELPYIPMDVALLSSNFAQVANVYIVGRYDWVALLLICLAVFSILVQVCDM